MRHLLGLVWAMALAPPTPTTPVSSSLATTATVCAAAPPLASSAAPTALTLAAALSLTLAVCRRSLPHCHPPRRSRLPLPPRRLCPLHAVLPSSPSIPAETRARCRRARDAWQRCPRQAGGRPVLHMPCLPQDLLVAAWHGLARQQHSQACRGRCPCAVRYRSLPSLPDDARHDPLAG